MQGLDPIKAGDHPRRDQGGAGGDGRAAGAHRDQRVHPREEGFLHRPVRRRRRDGGRLDGADLRRHHRPGVRPLPAGDDARGRSVLVQRLLCLARRGIAFQRPGVPGAGVPCRAARGVRDGLGAFRRHRRTAPGLDQFRCDRHLPGGHHHPADEADRCGHGERGGAGDLPSQFTLPGAEPRRCAGADGLGRSGGASREGDPRTLRTGGHGRGVRPAFRADPCAGAHPVARDIRGGHPSVQRRDRFRRPWQRPVPYPAWR